MTIFIPIIKFDCMCPVRWFTKLFTMGNASLQLIWIANKVMREQQNLQYRSPPCNHCWWGWCSRPDVCQFYSVNQFSDQWIFFSTTQPLYVFVCLPVLKIAFPFTDCKVNSSHCPCLDYSGLHHSVYPHGGKGSIFKSAFPMAKCNVSRVSCKQIYTLT